MNTSKVPLPSVTKPVQEISFFTSNKKVIITILVVVIVIAIAVGLYVYYKELAKTPQEKNAITQGKREDYLNNQYSPKTTKSLGELFNTVKDSQRYLINFSPLTASLGGYIGPKKGGTFNVPFYLDKALRSGIRSFVLPISTYKDNNKNPPDYPSSGDPAIVCRNKEDRTKIESFNGTSVGEFSKLLMNASSVNGAQINEPFLLFIQEEKGFVPDYVKDEEAYVIFMSKIAQQIQDGVGRGNMVTNLGEYGDATGGRRENELLCTIPINNFYGKVLIFTDFKTDLHLKSKYDTIVPRLHDFVNFIYKDTTSLEGSQDVRQAVKVRLEDVGSAVNWTDQARTKWHITSLDDPTVMPSTDAFESAFRKGIQSIPIPFFMLNEDEQDKSDDILKRWGGFAWRVKEIDTRFTKPAPVVPAKPSAKMNPRASPNLQPGQVAIL